MRKDQYVIKAGFRKPIVPTKLTRSKAPVLLEENIDFSSFGDLTATGVSLLRPEVVSAILCNYSRLKQDSYDNFTGDTWYLIYSFELLAEKALRQ